MPRARQRTGGWSNSVKIKNLIVYVYIFFCINYLDIDSLFLHYQLNNPYSNTRIMNQQGSPDLAQEAILKLQRLVRTLEQESRSTRKVYREYGVTETQSMILRHLAEYGPQPLNEMSKFFFVTPSNMTGIIDRLEAKGLAERKRQSDRRIVHIHLSGKGHQLTGVLPNPLVIKLHDAFSGMSTREIKAFSIPVQKLLQTLSVAQ